MTESTKTPLSREQVEERLQGLQDPWLNDSLLQVADINGISHNGSQLSVEVVLGYFCGDAASDLKLKIVECLQGLPGVESAVVELTTQLQEAPRTSDEPGLARVKNIVAVASGKGGVGKSTTSVNLALALAADGAKVGILDADIYGPSIGKMLGMAEDTRPGVEEKDGRQAFVPVEALGLKSNSMAYLVTETTPMVWRGPMASGALLQLLNQTSWGELDYLVVDMPPGTGDIQLTLSQKVPVAGSVIVTTPQDLALLDARKGIEMFNKVDVPVLGVVENMAVHVCSECGHMEYLFGEGGGLKMADEYKTDVLGALPLSLSIRQHVDAGLPTVAAFTGSSEEMSPEARLYRETARRTAARLAARNRQSAPIPTITMSDD